MLQKPTYIYFVPGLAAGGEIFKNLNFPDNYKIKVLEWLIPEKNETIKNYAKRMASLVLEKEAVLIGVSFGGVMVQEMAHFLDPKKVIIISSVKSRNEIPTRFKLAKTTKVHRLLPTRLLTVVQDFTVFSIGPKSRRRLKLYNEYLAVRDKTYLDWAIDQMVGWDSSSQNNDIFHIHGDNDIVFPIKYIANATIIEGGTHSMILNKAKKISKLIQNTLDNK